MKNNRTRNSSSSSNNQAKNENAYSIQITVRMRPLLSDFEDEEQWVVDKQTKMILNQQISSGTNINPSLIQSSSNEVQSNQKNANGSIEQQQSALMKRRYADAYASYAFTFDNVFGAEDSTETVYHSSCKDIVQGALDGFNSTIFMYGQTTSGKTFTMLGDMQNPGVLPYSLHDIFDIITKRKSEQQVEYSVLVSYIEIYNEQINDLLNPGMTNLRIHDDPKLGPVVQGMKQCEVNNFNEAIILMRFGEEHRCYKEKNIHEHSSRSHTIFQLKITSQSMSEEQIASAVSKTAVLNLVDLAGSERLHEEDTKNGNNEETGFINKSLFVLSNVINKLAEGKQQSTYIPYRDSKLTRFLSNALGGNSKTGIICTISPAAMNFYQTLSTMRFATRAKKLCTQPVINETKVTRNLSEINREIDQLHLKLQEKDSEIQIISKDKQLLETSLIRSNRQISLLHEELRMIRSQKNLDDDSSLSSKSNHQQNPNSNCILQQSSQEQQQYYSQLNSSLSKNRLSSAGLASSNQTNLIQGYDNDFLEVMVHQLHDCLWQNNNSNNIDEDSDSASEMQHQQQQQQSSQENNCWERMTQQLRRFKKDLLLLQQHYRTEISMIAENYCYMESQLHDIHRITNNSTQINHSFLHQLEQSLTTRLHDNTIFNGIAVNIILDPQLQLQIQTQQQADQHAVNLKAAYIEATESLHQKQTEYSSLIRLLSKQSINQFASEIQKNQLQQADTLPYQRWQSAQLEEVVASQCKYQMLMSQLNELFHNKLEVLESVFNQICSNLEVQPSQIYLPTQSDEESHVMISNQEDVLVRTPLGRGGQHRNPLNEQTNNSSLNILPNSCFTLPHATANQHKRAFHNNSSSNNTPYFEEFLSNRKQNGHQPIIGDSLRLDDFSLISEQENILQNIQKSNSSEFHSALRAISPSPKQLVQQSLKQQQPPQHVQQSLDIGKEFADGTILTYAWGSGKDGRLGTGTEKGENTPVLLPNMNFIYLSCGSYHSAAITDRGEVYMWGKGNSGQLGNGKWESSRIPILAGINESIAVVQVVCGWQHTMALSSCGQVYSWGLGEEGQLGHGSSQNLCAPKVVEQFKRDSKQIKFIACGHSHSAAITEEGDLYTWGCNYDYRLMVNNNKNQHIPVVSELHTLREKAKQNGNIQLADSLRVELVSLGVSHSAVITSDGSVYTAGLGNEGELGVKLTNIIPNVQLLHSTDGLTKQHEDKCCYLHKVQTFNESNRAIDVACGGEFTVVVNTDNKLYAFGRNIIQAASSSLYQSTTLPSKRSPSSESQHQFINQSSLQKTSIPTPEIVKEMAEISVLQVSAGKNHIIVITDKGEVYTWGKNFYEKLEHAEKQQDNQSTRPSKLQFSKQNQLQCIQVSCGEFHSLCLAKCDKLPPFSLNRY